MISLSSGTGSGDSSRVMNQGSIMEETLKTIQTAVNKIDTSRLVGCGIVLVIAIALFIVARIVFKRIKRKHIDPTDLRKRQTVTTIHRVVKVLIVFGSLMAIMQICGININAIVFSVSLITALLTLAVKDVLQDFFAGIIILSDKFFKVGDAVEYQGKEGIVIYFSLRSTKIECLDDRSVLSVANRNISEIRRLTHLVDIDLPLSYDEDRRTVYAVLEKICAQVKEIEGVEDCVLKGTQLFADSAIIYKIRFFCEPNNRPDIRRAVLRTIQDGLDEAGIQIPYNQLDIHQK